MDFLTNLDLLSVGIAIAGIGILGFVVYFNNRKSVTNRSFLYFSLITIGWGIVNYLSYQFDSKDIVLWLIRFVMFFAVFQAFFLYRLFHVFPETTYKFRKRHIYGIIPLVIITAGITLTPLLFSNIIGELKVGEVAQVAKGPGLFLFGVVAVGLVIRGIYLLSKKAVAASLDEKRPFKMVLWGTIIMFILIITFNFIIPAFYDNPRFIPLGALFIFPFVAFTSYAILKHKLFNVKVAATATLMFVLSVITFLEVIFSRDFSQVMFRSSVFLLVLIFGILLIRTVKKEIMLREEIETLAESLKKANVRLRELDKMKSEFVSFATHQIRAPITAIKGYASMILEGSFGQVSGKLKDAIDKIFQSSESLVLVIEDYLNISRIELGRMQYAMSVFDFKRLVEEITMELIPTIRKAEINISVHKESGKSYRLRGDSGKLRQVVINLIDNAVKYTPKGSIRVDLSKDDERNKIILAISDTGVGISKEVMPHLFEKFNRAKNANNVNIHGTGLGLYIAKQIIDSHKGRIWAESDGEGEGSKFFVELNAEE